MKTEYAELPACRAEKQLSVQQASNSTGLIPTEQARSIKSVMGSNLSKKSYAVLLMTDNVATEAIVKFRVQSFGEELVQNLLPHITLKRWFTLKEGFTEANLIKVFEEFPISKIKVAFGKPEVFGKMVALPIENDRLFQKHQELLVVLGNRIVTDNENWEEKNFKPHLTLMPFSAHSDEILNLKEATFDLLCLYSEEGGGTSRQVTCKKI